MSVEVETSGRQRVLFVPCETLVSYSGPTIQLEDDLIHLWGFTLEGSLSCVEAFRQWLDEEEQVRASRFVRQEDRRRYILAHGSLRVVLSRYAGCAPKELTFKRRAEGKPYLVPSGAWQQPPTFNMAHSHERALIAVANQEIGVDLERSRSKIELLKLAERFFTRSDYARLAGLPQVQQASEFFRYWVAKEAVLKAQGIGLHSLGECEVLPAVGGNEATIRAVSGSAIQPGWMIRWLSCGAGWEGAVAFLGEHRFLRNMTTE
jgi:4'-phosphopantetheinyl transferase